MPSNKDLIEQSSALAKALGIGMPETKGLNNDALVKLVAELEAAADAKAKADAESEAARERAETAAREEAETAARAAKSAPVYIVGPKSSVTSLRGILVQGTVVTARDFHGGEKSFDHLVARGVVVERS